MGVDHRSTSKSAAVVPPPPRVYEGDALAIAGMSESLAWLIDDKNVSMRRLRSVKFAFSTGKSKEGEKELHVSMLIEREAEGSISHKKIFLVKDLHAASLLQVMTAVDGAVELAPAVEEPGGSPGKTTLPANKEGL